MGQIEKVRALLKLGSEDTEEGRTAAHQAARLIGKFGFVLSEPTEIAPSVVAAPPGSSTPPSNSGADWADRLRAGVSDFVGEGLRQAGIVLPVVVFVKRRTRCNGCGRTVAPPHRMMRHRKHGLRCVPCSQRWVG